MQESAPYAVNLFRRRHHRRSGLLSIRQKYNADCKYIQKLYAVIRPYAILLFFKEIAGYMFGVSRDYSYLCSCKVWCTFTSA
jgi:hypothetical protein